MPAITNARIQRGHGERAKVLRVKLPIRYHLRLHQIKLYLGKTMAESVEEALEQYFHLVDVPWDELPNQLPDQAEDDPAAA